MKYDHTILESISKIAKRMTAQIKHHLFDRFELTSITGFLCNFKLTRDSDRTYQGAAMWLVHFFVKKLVSSALHLRSTSNQKARMRVSSKANAATLTTYTEVVSCLLRAYATDVNIASAEDEISSYSQPPRKSPAQYADELSGRALLCGFLYGKQSLSKVIIRILNKSDGHGVFVFGYWSFQNLASLQDLAFNATFFLKLQRKD